MFWSHGCTLMYVVDTPRLFSPDSKLATKTAISWERTPRYPFKR